ncbi:transmembrane protein 260-like [Scleropages formosus]|uniref:Transmembrane protein 260-like n=1 Tax=Scleropages formosus TaxID=113540 RepID=A0A0P7W9R6_SCLFO|nr:transmembrane protein 260-like [Scleropages formosus]
MYLRIPGARGSHTALTGAISLFRRLAGPGPGAVLAGGVFALSLLTWRWSVVAEVFSLNNLFVGSILALAASFHRADGAGERRKVTAASNSTKTISECVIDQLCRHVSLRQFSRWGALCCGLGLCNQHTLVLYVVPVIPWVLLRLHTYQAKADGSVGSARMLRAQLDHCVAHLTVPVLILAGISLLLSLWDRRQYVLPWLLAAMVLLYSLFFAWRANLDISRPLLLGVVERFWLQGDAVLCVLSGLGLAGLCAALERWLARGTLWTACAWALTAGLLAHLARSNYRECDQSRNDVVERFARGILDSMPQDSLLLTRGDLPGNSLRYLHYCQGLRPDLRLVDQEMMTYGWYVAKLGRHHPGVRFPGRRWDPARAAEEDAFGLERFLRHNSDRDVFACIGLPEGDPGWMRSFSRWPWGICEQLVPAETRLQPEAWARRTRSLYNWTEPHDSFRAGSWEKVANEEMWQARMKTAFFLFDVAEKVPEEGKERLFELSYTLYKEIVDAHENHPSNWDKNLALAGERLLRYGGRGHDPDRLLAQTIESFSLYLEKEPADPKAEAIRSVISHLRKERQRLRRSRHAT